MAVRWTAVACQVELSGPVHSRTQTQNIVVDRARMSEESAGFVRVSPPTQTWMARLS